MADVAYTNATVLNWTIDGTLDGIVEPWSRLRLTRVPIYVSYLVFLFLSVITIFSISFNLITIASFCKFRMLRKPLNYLLINIAVADILCAVFGSLVCAVASVRSGYFLGKWVCNAEAFAISVLGIVHLLSLVFLGTTRYIIVCKPCGLTVTHRRAIASVVITWIWSVGWALPPLFWDGYDLEGIGASCGPTWNRKEGPSRMYLFLYLIFCFVLPLAQMTVSYWMIYSHARKTARQSSITRRVSKKSEKSITRMVALMLGAFLLCWLPYATLAVYVLLSTTTQVNQYAATVPALFAKSSAIYNPCIYYLKNDKFRKCLKAFVTGTRPTEVRSNGYTGARF